MATDPMLVTTDPHRVQLVRRVREDLRLQAMEFSMATVERILDAYDRRRMQVRYMVA